MAFVYRSEKTTQISPNREEFEIGPGQYLSQENPIKRIKPNKAPFLSKTLKEDTSRKKSRSPGPGAYFIEDGSRISLLENNNQTEKERHKLETIKAFRAFNNDDLPNLSEILNLKNTKENLGFNVKETRFKQDSNIYVPGPGYYLKSKDKILSGKVKNTTANIKCLNKNRVHKYHVNNQNKIVSIPNKFQSYGYELQEDGSILLNNDPESFKKFKGEILDSVGPGNYDFGKTLNWYKRGTQWSKSKTPKNVFDQQKEKDKFNYKTSDNYNSKHMSKSLDNLNHEDFKRNQSHIERSFSKKSKKFKSSTVLKSNNTRKIIRKTNYNELMEIMDFPNKTDIIQRGISLDTPGPGYYFKDDMSLKGGQFISNYNNFLSNQERFIEKVENTTLGPGSYFREEDKYGFYKSFKKDNSIAFNRTKEKSTANFNTHVPDIPGPGQYDPDVKFKGKKKFSTQSYFGSTERRFAQLSNQKKENTPGPGYYNAYQENKAGINMLGDSFLLKNLNNRKVIYERPKLVEKENSERLKNLPSTEVPPVGAYNPHHLFNIDYKIHKKVNKLSLVETAFNTTVGKTRFNMNKEENSGGPGYYYKEKKVPSMQVYPAFKANDRRFGEIKPQMTLNGPGSYNHTSYHDWNKKTFNILYL